MDLMDNLPDCEVYEKGNTAWATNSPKTRNKHRLIWQNKF